MDITAMLSPRQRASGLLSRAGELEPTGPECSHPPLVISHYTGRHRRRRHSKPQISLLAVFSAMPYSRLDAHRLTSLLIQVLSFAGLSALLRRLCLNSFKASCIPGTCVTGLQKTRKELEDPAQ